MSETIEDLQLRTCRELDIRDINLRSPELDFEGFWLFALFDQPWTYRGVKMGFSVGRYEGEDLGVGIKGDPGNVLCVLDLVGDRESFSFSTDRLSRSQVTSSARGLDIRFGPFGRLSGEWPELTFCVTVPGQGVSVDLRLSGNHVHWWPDMLLPGTFYRQYVCPDMRVSGEIAIGGTRRRVSGAGALDRPYGRLVKSPSSRGVGYWHYDVIAWEGGKTSVGWLVTDTGGKVSFAYGMGGLAGEELVLFDSFDIEYLEVERRGTTLMPRRWKGALSSPRLTLAYEVQAVGQEYDPTHPDSSFLLPNLLLRCQGTLQHAGREVSMQGWGLPEYHVAHRSPEFNCGVD